MNPVLFFIGNLGLCLVCFISLKEKIFSRNNILFYNDKLFLLVIAIFLSTISLCFLKGGIFNIDEAFYLSASRTLLFDPRPWVSVDPTTSGPLNLTAGMLLLSLNDAATYGDLRLLYVILFQIPSIVFVFYSIRSSQGLMVSRLTMIPLIVTLGLFSSSDFLHASSEQAPVLIIAVFFYAINRLRYHEPQLWISTLLGPTLVAGFFTKLQAAPIIGGLVALYLLLLFLKTATLKHYLLFAFSSCLFAALSLGYIYSYGGIEDFIKSYIVGNLFYTDTSHASWKLVRAFLRLSALHVMPLEVWALIVIILAIRHRNKKKTYTTIDRWYHIGTIVVALLSILAVSKPGRFFEHYSWLLILPFYFLFSFYFVEQNFKPKITTAAVGFYIILLLTIGVYQATPLLEYKPVSGTDSALISFIDKVKKTDDRLSVWGWGSRYNHETKLLMGTRDVDYNFPVHFKGEVGEYYRNRFLSDLKLNRPKWFLDMVTTKNVVRSNSLENFPKINNYIQDHYQQVYKIDNKILYVIKEPRL